MVLQLQLRRWSGVETLIRRVSIVILCSLAAASVRVYADDRAPSGSQYLEDSSHFYKAGEYFKAARYAFAALQQEPSLKPSAYSWITMGLLHAGLPNAASYFFIRTLQSGNHAAIHSVLTQAQDLLVVVGADILRKYMVRHTRYEEYDSVNRGAYLFALGKEALLSGENEKAVSYLNGMDSSSPLWPFALQLRGTALAVAGRNEEAISDFKSCASKASRVASYEVKGIVNNGNSAREADDLRSRCVAGEARTLYQMDRFDDADRVYDSIPKKSFVWPDILFEQAWNSFAREQYNRTLGKLVSYKSPALTFMFNSEVDVLRAQSYLALCLYNDANDAIKEFNRRYTPVGEEVKEFVERNANNLGAFYGLGKSALRSSLYTKNGFYQLANRFVRGPYFQNLVLNERQVASEMEAIRRFDSSQRGVSHNLGQGFPGFLNEVLQWRLRSVRLLGGAFVKNSLLDYHSALIEDYEKMAFIKLEMLRLAKDKLVYKHGSREERSRGNVEPSRRDDQYKWSFNGEFWNDELGDYVFGLESECNKS